jgi:Sulfotransferase family
VGPALERPAPWHPEAVFLVLGQPRSGTTLVAQCLNGHPDLVLPDETDVVVPLAFLVDRIEDPDVGRELAAALVTSSRRFADSLGRYVSPEAAATAIRSAPWTLRGVLAALYAAVADSGGGRLAGDKSPNDLKFTRILLTADLFGEDLPVIHVVRDVRDVMASFKDLGWADGVPEGLVRFWVANNLMVRANVPRRGSPYLLVRYEDVVADPEGQFRAMCDLLGVAFDREMLSDERRYQQFEGHKAIGQHARTYEPISAARIGSHRDSFDAETIRRLTELGREGLDAFGYP